MKTSVILVALAALGLSITSCQKEITGEMTVPTDTTGSVNTGSLVRTYTESVTSSTGEQIGTTFNVTYDQSNRIKSLVSTANAGDKFVYEYNGNISYSMEIFNSGVLSIRGDFFLNSFGFVDSSRQYNDASDTSIEKYVYNDRKQLVQTREYEVIAGTGRSLINTTSYVYDNNGNVIKETEDNKETTYEYFPDLLNNLNFGRTYFPQHKNLIKTTTITGSVTETVNHTYTFDSLNRITSQKSVVASGETATKSYTY